jgi:hypothetical protein
MARKSKSGVNVSAAIRDYLNTNTGVGPTEAAAAISKQIGKTVTPIYVSNVKTLMNTAPKKKGRQGRKPKAKAGRVAVTARADANGSVQLTTIVAVRALLANVGAERAKQLIDLLA